MAHVTFDKPRRGDFLLERRQGRAQRVQAEQAVMQAALKRDRHTCRFPNCPFAKKGMVIDPAHLLQHRQMGGNPSGDRTEHPRQILALCRRHHDMFDKYDEIDIEPMSSTLLADGPLAYYARHPETGRMQHVYTERTHGVSETRGA